MKKLLLSVVVATLAIMATGCKKINNKIDRLDERLSQLEGTTIPSIDEQIDGINKTIKALEKIDAELKGCIKTLQQQAATATEQIKKLQEKDVALEQKIAELRQYVDAEIQKTKDWAETAFATLEQYNSVTSEIESLKESLKTAGKETEALKQSIGDLESDIASIKTTLAELTKNVEAIKGDIAKLLGRIQSVTYVPKYTDGKVEMKRTMGEDDGIAEFDFAVTPAEAVKELANVWSVAVKMRAVYTETRAVSFIDMPIISLVADESNGVITVKASGKNLSEDFFGGKSVASASLVISDGNASVASEYVPMYGKNDTSLVDDLYTIYYTTSNNQECTTPIESQTGFVSNTYEDGQGKIKFDRKITTIANSAFKDCKVLTSVTIPDSVTTIGDSAFYNCRGLTSVTIPDSVTSIGNSAFSGCTGLTSITIPDSVTFIGYYAFDDCKSMTSINIPNGITNIYDYAFYGCAGLTSITIPDSVTTICRSAFNECTSLTNVTIPDSVTSIGDTAFGNCTGLNAFYGKYTSVDNRCLVVNGELIAFAPAGLTEYTIPDSVTFIGQRAFYDCTGLTSINIPDSVTEIGDYAFDFCKNLTTVYCKAATPPTLGSHCTFDIASAAKIYVPRASLETYKTTRIWEVYASKLVGYDF